MHDLEKLARTVTCPSCHVKPGRKCVIQRNHSDLEVHLTRVDRARAKELRKRVVSA